MKIYELLNKTSLLDAHPLNLKDGNIFRIYRNKKILVVMVVDDWAVNGDPGTIDIQLLKIKKYHGQVPRNFRSLHDAGIFL